MPDSGNASGFVEQIRYICRIIDDGHFNLELKWSSVIETLSSSIGIGNATVLDLLKEANLGFSGNPEADFVVAGVFDAEIGIEEKKVIFTNILGQIDSSKKLKNILLLVSTEYNFTLALIEFLFMKGGHHLDVFTNDPLLPIVTSDLFIESGTANTYVMEHVRDIMVDFDRVRDLAPNDWFMDLMTILKSGVPVNQSRGFLKLIERESRTVNTEEVLSLISDGTLEMIVLNRNSVLKQSFITKAFLKRFEAEQHEKKLRRFYYWLGIANDLVLGVLFLVGSIEFLPSMPSGSLLIGVILFIVGSIQLVARSMIQIVMNIHIRSSRNRKMREVSG